LKAEKLVGAIEPILSVHMGSVASIVSCDGYVPLLFLTRVPVVLLSERRVLLPVEPMALAVFITSLLLEKKYSKPPFYMQALFN